MYALHTYIYETRSLNFLKIEKVFTKVKDFHCNECPFPPDGIDGIDGIDGKSNFNIIETGHTTTNRLCGSVVQAGVLRKTQATCLL